MPARRLRQLLLGGLALAGGCAQAQWALSVAAESDYRLRGVSLSDGRPSARVSLSGDAADGRYAGLSATRATAGGRYRSTTAYAGQVFGDQQGPRVEVGGSYAQHEGEATMRHGEAYAGVLGERWAARLSYAPRYFGQRQRALYGELDAWLRLSGDGARLFGHVGALSVLRGAAAGTAWGDVRLGAAITPGDWDLHLAWVAGGHAFAPQEGGRSGRSRAWVVGASTAF